MSRTQGRVELALTAIVAVAATASCGGPTAGSGGKVGVDAANCGGAQEPCCDATACDNGLTCRGGTCVDMNATDGAVGTVDSAPGDSGEAATVDAAPDAVDGAAATCVPGPAEAGACNSVQVTGADVPGVCGVNTSVLPPDTGARGLVPDGVYQLTRTTYYGSICNHGGESSRITMVVCGGTWQLAEDYFPSATTTDSVSYDLGWTMVPGLNGQLAPACGQAPYGTTPNYDYSMQPGSGTLFLYVNVGGSWGRLDELLKQ